MVIAFLPGLLTGLSLIIAIGAQNAFVIRQGLATSHVLLVVVICAASDALLIFLGTGGLGALIQSQPRALEVIRWFGVIYLTYFGLKTLGKVFRSGAMSIEGAPSISRSAAIACSATGASRIDSSCWRSTARRPSRATWPDRPTCPQRRRCRSASRAGH